MTDTGQVPGEGLPENAGMVEQPGVPGAYTYLSETTAEDEDLLLLPGAQSAWGNEVAPPAPEPVVEALHEPGAHEISGRDSGSVDLSAVRNPAPVPPTAPRRPLHLGPPTPDASASPVRSLADRGAVGAPVRQPAQPAPGPEYLDMLQPQPTAPWGSPAPAPAPSPLAAPVAVEAPAAETVVPQAAPQFAPPVATAAGPLDPAQAAMARLTTEAVAVARPEEEPALGHTAPEPQEDGTAPVAAAPADGAAPAEASAPGGDSADGPGNGHPAAPAAEDAQPVAPVEAAQPAGPAQVPAPESEAAQPVPPPAEPPAVAGPDDVGDAAEDAPADALAEP
ncbi:5,6-dimethylbenzimidazole synthase, partial [Streptomyces sp. NPDC058865]